MKNNIYTDKLFEKKTKTRKFNEPIQIVFSPMLHYYVT